MIAIGKLFRDITGISARQRDAQRASTLAEARASSIVAANSTGGTNWQGVTSEYDEDAFNKDYLYSLGKVQQRSQDLDVNNPDIGGSNRTRTGQIIGAGVKFKFAPVPAELKLSQDDVKKIAVLVDRARELHSMLGGFDASGKGRSEGKQQERAILTMKIYGAVLIHRVGRSNGRAKIRSFSIELIPGCRISTPNDRAGDPLISYGIEYSDELRSRIVGYHVRRVSKTVGNSFVPSFVWDFIPAEDAAYLSMTEAAGLDREMPACVRVIRQAKNRGEFVESAVESARAQADHWAYISCAPNADPYKNAFNDSKQVMGTNFTRMGNGVKVMYGPAGEKMDFLSSKLPEPDFKGFSDVMDSRMARGLVMSKSAFTREVSSSYSAGRMEKQQDDPLIAQDRRSFLDAWHRVNEWFIEALWLENVVKLPGYSASTKCFWAQHRATFPGQVAINPVQTMAAREQGFMIRSQNPYGAAEEDGSDAEEQLDLWAKYHKARTDKEDEYKLPRGTLDILFSGKAISTSAGGEIAPPKPETPDDDSDDEIKPAAVPSKKTNGRANGHRFVETN